MKRLIFLLLTICFATTMNAQVKYEFTYNSKLGYQKNCALLTKATIDVKGYEWYEQYILKNIVNGNLKLVSCHISFYSNGTYKIIYPKFLLPEIKNVMPQILSYIEQNKYFIYGHDMSSPTLNIMEKRLILKYRTSISDDNNPDKYIFSAGNFIMGTIETIVPYKKLSYLKENKENAYTNFRKWYLNELDSIIALPIKSTLDDDINILEFLKK